MGYRAPRGPLPQRAGHFYVMPHQNARESAYAAIGVEARWLDEQHAKHAYAYASKLSSIDRYGLNGATVRDIQRIEVESHSVADAWLGSRLEPTGTVQVVFGEGEVCVISAADLLTKWKELFVPGRDDAIILHNENAAVVFYCHEDELEFGYREA